MRGKCNCGKKAVSEWLIQDKKLAWTIKLCDKCQPKVFVHGIYMIDGYTKSTKKS